MPSTSRDRLMIDLRGIGDAVRARAAEQRITVSQLARRALLASVDAGTPCASAPGSVRQTPGRSITKLMLRMPSGHAETLILNATALGLSYGEYVALLVQGRALPRPSAERQADRAALLASNDQLASLSADLNVLARLLRGAKSENAQRYRDRLEATDGEVRRHLDRTSTFINSTERTRP